MNVTEKPKMSCRSKTEKKIYTTACFVAKTPPRSGTHVATTIVPSRINGMIAIVATV